MNSVPVELLYALIFAAVLLVQYLMKRLGGWPQPADALQEAPAPEELPPERDLPVPASWASVLEVPALSLAAAERAVRLEATAANAAIPRQRSASRTLLGGGQDLRRAIVGITLLGPCRAQEPPESR